MKKFLQKKLKNEKGLTLVELLAVVVILGIIAAIAIPAIGNIIENSRVNALKGDGQNVLAAANIYFTDQEESEVTGDKLLSDGYLDDAGGFGDGTGVTVKKVQGGNTIKGTAKKNKTSVEFKDATSASINATKQTSSDTVVITKE